MRRTGSTMSGRPMMRVLRSEQLRQAGLVDSRGRKRAECQVGGNAGFGIAA